MDPAPLQNWNLNHSKKDDRMNRMIKLALTACCIVAVLTLFVVFHSREVAHKPGPDMALKMLKDGNQRFVKEKTIHPNIGSERLKLAGKSEQKDYAYATVITCSDSRVPVELIFDAGVMDIFVVRVAGNVCDVDEIGSIEYGLAHVHTPVLVVLGHTRCGAVTAVTHALSGKGHALERNIVPLVDNISPAVSRAMAMNPDITGDDIIPYAIEENVWQGIEDLFMNSPATREIVKKGIAKVVGAIYDVSTGEIDWLPESNVLDILKKVEGNPGRAIEDETSGHHPAQGGESGKTKHQ